MLSRIIFIIFCLNSCTFTPLYRNCKSDSVVTHDIEFNITPVQSKARYLLTKKLNLLINALEIKTKQPYLIKIQLDQFSKNIAISANSTINRKEISYLADIQIIDKKNYKTVAKTKIESSESYNALYSSSNIIHSTYGNTDKNQIEVISQKIINYIGVVLNAS